MIHLDDRLENWSRYYRTRLKRQCCGSLEGNYRSNWRQYAELHEISHSSLIDWADAEMVELAWRGMLGKHKLILKYTYMARMPDYVVCRKSGIKRWELSLELMRAKKIIQNQLDTLHKREYFALNLNRETERICPIEADFAFPKETEPA